MKRYIISFELEDTFLAESEEDAVIQMVEQINSMSTSQLMNCMETNVIEEEEDDK